MRICVFEDAACAGLEPLVLTRPVFDLRCGSSTLLERQARHFRAEECGVQVRPFLADYCRFLHPELSVNEPAWAGRGPLVLVNGRWLPGETTPPPDAAEVGVVDGQTAYVALPGGAAEISSERLARRPEEWERTLPRRDVGGVMVARPWDLIECNGAALRQDFLHRAAGREWSPVVSGAAVVGPPGRVLIDPAARVEPMVVIDATNGPVMIDRGAVVQAFSRIEGPCYVGPDSHVLGAKLRASSVGPGCRVGGEVESSILHGFANKAHDGFLGHSYVGEWVNLGAGTQTSDLRADYGTVTFRLGGRTVESGLRKVGAFLGDHVRTSINAQLNTGTTVGAFSLLLTGGGLLPRVVPAFCRVGHGRLQERTDLRELFETAAVVMARRGRQWTETHAEFAMTLYERTAACRRQMMRDRERKESAR